MTSSRNIALTSIGLRAYDTAIGFRNLDIRSAALTDFDPTHTIGMAAILAGAIKDKDVVRNARSLKKIAADVLKINPWAFDKVVLELAELEMVRSVQRQGEKSFLLLRMYLYCMIISMRDLGLVGLVCSLLSSKRSF
jgi:hypothetical protein